MSTDWPECTVIELQNAGLLLVEDGNHGEYRPHTTEFVSDGIALIRAADMDAGRLLFASAARINDVALKRIRKGIGAPGDVILSHKGTVGKVAFAPLGCEPFVCSPQTTFWRTLNNNRIDRRFLYFFLRSHGFQRQLDSRKDETDMAAYVSLTAQRALRVVVPPIVQQRAIAAVLGALDDKIELNRRMNETLEALARALFQSWFVDFDPVRAKAAGEQPVGMDSETAKLFPDSFASSANGEIPERWRRGKLATIGCISRAGLNPGVFPDEVFDHYSLPSFDEGRLPKAEAGEHIRSNKFVVPADAVLLSKINPRIPRVWLPRVSSERRSICSTEFLVVTPTDGASGASGAN